MTERMGYTPKTHELMEEGERIDREFNSLPPIQEAGKLLESALLSDKFKYYPQSKEIKECLKETFGENERYIRFVNKFLYDVGELIDSYHNLSNFKGDKNSHQYKEGEIRFEGSKMEIFSYFTEYGAELYDRLQTENPGKNIEEIALILGKLEQKFIELLLQRIQYIPNKE